MGGWRRTRRFEEVLWVVGGWVGGETEEEEDDVESDGLESAAMMMWLWS